MALDKKNKRLLELISNAAFDSAKWPSVCDGLSQLVDGCGTIILPLNSDAEKIGMPHSQSLAEAFHVYMNDGWHKRDLRYNAVEAIRHRGFAIDTDCITYDDVNRSDYYQEFLHPLKLSWFLGLGVGSVSDAWCFSVQRSLGKSPFSSQEIKTVLAYRHALNNSVMISRELGFAKIKAASSIMEAYGRSVVALDSAGCVLHVSIMAEAYIGKAFKIQRGQLSARFEHDRLSLENFIKSLCIDQNLNGSTSSISLSRGIDEAPLVIHGTQLPISEREIFFGAKSLLVIVDPDRQFNISSDILMDYYDITRAEAKLAISMFQGHSVEAHSLANGISPVTTRNHLQGLLRKTRTHSKSEFLATLVKIIM